MTDIDGYLQIQPYQQIFTYRHILTDIDRYGRYTHICSDTHIWTDINTYARIWTDIANIDGYRHINAFISCLYSVYI